MKRGNHSGGFKMCAIPTARTILKLHGLPSSYLTQAEIDQKGLDALSPGMHNGFFSRPRRKSAVHNPEGIAEALAEVSEASFTDGSFARSSRGDPMTPGSFKGGSFPRRRSFLSTG